MTVPRVISEPLGGGGLTRLLLSGEAPAAWWSSAPSSADGWAARIQHVASAGGGSGWLRALAPALNGGGIASGRLERAANGGVVVTTGQQPGLFGGPLYTLAKALTALSLADALEALSGVPVAPVFWAATDDTDFDEACWTAVAVPGGVERLSVGAPAGSGVPMSRTPLGDATSALAALRRAAGSAADSRLLDAASRAYVSNGTVGDAYVTLLRELLEPLGIAVLDASHECVRSAGYAVTSRALERADEVAVALAARSNEIAARGFVPQVSDVSGLSLVFGYEGDTRSRITAERARDWISRTGHPLGANVLLRPVVERSILPTVAYVAGPAELAYFAQTSAVADALELERPVGVPRWSGTILEPHVERLMEKHGLTIEDARSEGVTEGRLARARLPREAAESLERLKSGLEDGLAALRSGAGNLLDDRVIEGARRSLGHRLQRLERRLLAAVKRHETEGMRELATIRGALNPWGKRQERALNALPFLARHGEPLMRELLSATGAHARRLAGSERPAASASAAAR